MTLIPETGGWFCQMNASGDGWECVQDPALAERPRPERLPQPPAAPEPERSPDALPVPTGAPAPAGARPPGTPQSAPPPQPAAPQPDADPVPQPAAAPVGAEPAAAPAVPEHVRLAYRPERETALTDLPQEFYAVQLVAMSSKAALEAFVERKGIAGMSAARVEKDGKLFYVLLLGIYENHASAHQAVASLPREIDGATPWIRPLGSLQAAMRRADALAGSSRF